MNKKSQGFGVVEVLLIIAVVALMAFIGYRVWSANSTEVSDNPTPAATRPADEPNKINNESDLNKASESLDSTDVEGDSSEQLNAELSY